MHVSQSVPPRPPSVVHVMSPLLLLVLAELLRARGALVAPSLGDRLERLSRRLDTLTVAPEPSFSDRIAAKIDQLNAIGLDKVEDEDEDEALLSALQRWGSMSPQQLAAAAQELQLMRADREPPDDFDYSDDAWNEEELQYYADGEDWEQEQEEELDAATPRPPPPPPPGDRAPPPGDRAPPPGDRAPPPGEPALPLLAADPARVQAVTVDPIDATNERPRILDDSSRTAAEQRALRRAVLANAGAVVRAGRCLAPQPRWLPVRQLAPAADIVYTPPCVQLHRCAADTGCCNNEAELCAPRDGRYVAIPFYLHKADGKVTAARMLFYNHTRCGCVPRAQLQRGPERQAERQAEREAEQLAERREERVAERQGAAERQEKRQAAREPWWQATEESREDATAPPQLMRCTCPTVFVARANNTTCACACDWPDLSRRHDCFSLAKGREHFGLRDRVCIASGDCAAPRCAYGPYDAVAGRCPVRKVKRRFFVKRWRN